MDQNKMQGLVRGAQMSFEEAEAMKKAKLLEQLQGPKAPESWGTDPEKYEAAQRKIQEIIDRGGGEPVLEPQPELRPPTDIENDPYARVIPMPEDQMKLNALRKLKVR